MDVEEGERIRLSLFKSADPEEGDFHPALVLLGPGLPESSGPLPRLSLPPGASELRVMAAEAGGAEDAVYEPFGPSSLVEISGINITAPVSARYYAAVYNNDNNTTASVSGASGHYGLAVGYKEEVSFTDRIMTPLRLISVYLWEGQSLAMILVPYFAAGIVGLFVFWRGSRRTSFRLAGTLAGFFFLATAATVLNQTGLQPHPRPLRPRGLHHPGHSPLKRHARSGRHPAGGRRSRDTAESAHGGPWNRRPPGRLRTGAGAAHGHGIELFALPEGKHLEHAWMRHWRRKKMENSGTHLAG